MGHPSWLIVQSYCRLITCCVALLQGQKFWISLARHTVLDRHFLEMLVSLLPHPVTRLYRTVIPFTLCGVLLSQSTQCESLV